MKINPDFKTKLLGWCVVLSIFFAICANFTGWINSVRFCNELSLAAIFLSFGAWWDAQGAKEAVEEDDDG